MLRTHALGAQIAWLLVTSGLALFDVQADAAEAAPASETPSNLDSAKKGEAAPETTEQPKRANQGARPQPVQLPMTVVTGSRLRPAAEQSAQDVHIYDRLRIERSGQTTLADFLNTLPEVSLNSAETATVVTTVRLRGSLPGSALVLINGHRVEDVTGASSVLGFFDLNVIPISLVERIEILPTGSSAIYGGDALAGVVNIVLKSNFTGVVADAGYKFAHDTAEKTASVGVGWKAGPFSASIMGNFSHRYSLYGKDRAITASADYSRYGGPNLNTPFFGAPANVYSVSGNLPGLNSSFAAVPLGSSGIGLRPSDFAATAGTLNSGSFVPYLAMINDTERYGLFASVNYRFDSFELFAELLASKYRLNIPNVPAFLPMAAVPSSNAFNPFGTTVLVSGVVQGATQLSPFISDQHFMRPMVGGRGEIGNWHWEFSGVDSRDRGTQVAYGQPNAALLSSALASPDPGTALNPFVDGPMGSPALLSSIYSNTQRTDFNSEAAILNGFLRGPLLKLPAGALDAVLGVEFQHSTLSRGFNASRNVKSAFAELRAPIIDSEGGSGDRREILAVQTAARYDDYSDFSSKTTWQVGVEFRPATDVLLRGTHSTAFKPPTLYNLAASVLSFPNPVTDPRRNGETLFVQSMFGGNPDLGPTTGTSNTLGILWSPRQIPHLNLSLTPWWLRIEGAINLPSVQYIVDNEALYPNRVVRAPGPPGTVGQITSVDFSYLNFGKMDQSGIDANIDWTFNTKFGHFTPAIAATYITKFVGASTAGAQSISRLSRANFDGIFAPRWKGTASIGWAPDDPFKLWLAGRYIGRYVDFTPPRTLGNVWYFDATLEVDLMRALHIENSRLGGVKLLVSGTNLANTLPPYSTYSRGYDVYNYDIVGRSIFVRLQFQQ